MQSIVTHVTFEMGIYIDAKYGPLKMNILGKNSLSAVNSMADCQTFHFCFSLLLQLEIVL